MTKYIDEHFESGIPAAMSTHSYGAYSLVPAIDAVAANTGAFGVKCGVNTTGLPASTASTDGSYLGFSMPTQIVDDANIRFHFRIPDHLPLGWSTLSLLEIHTNVGMHQVRVANRGGGTTVFTLRYMSNGVWKEEIVGSPLVLDQKYCIELHERKGAGVGLGQIDLYVDGVLVRTDVTDLSGVWARCYIGVAPLQTETYEAYRGPVSVYLDDFAIGDAYIGPMGALASTLTVKVVVNGTELTGVPVTLDGVDVQYSPAVFANVPAGSHSVEVPPTIDL